MTAFDNIKTNNWPAASNDFEDFLVFKLPLNDQASLTESLPVTAGSTLLHPKRTLANTGVSISEAGPNYSALISGSVDSNYPLSNLFGGTIGTSYTSGTRATNPGTLTLTLTSLNITVTNVRLSTYIYNTPSTFTVNGTTVPRGTGNGDKDYVVAVNGQLNTIAWSYDSSSGPYCYMRGIEVDYGDGNGYQLLTDAPGGARKHYDNNASFNGSSAFLYHEPDSLFNLGTDDWAIECWFNKDNLTATGQLFQLGLEVYYSDNIEISIGPNGDMRYHMYGNGTSQEGFTSANSVVTAGTWHHMACTRQGTTFRGFLDGVQLGSWTKAANWNVGHPTVAQNTPTIGARTNGSRSAMHVYFGGSIQDFRLYKGIAKYTANFTPPPAILG